MRYGVAMVTVMAWGLWFGGMAALVLLVGYLFGTDRKIAIIAAPRMFEVFETYQLFIAAIALVAAAAWRLVTPGRAAITFLFAMLAIAAVGTIASALAVRPPLERLRVAGQGNTPQFQRLHKLSERLYGAQMLALLAGGVVIPVALGPARRRAREAAEETTTGTSTSPQTAPEAARPTTPPGEPADQVV
jgi:hypothetical protein